MTADAADPRLAELTEALRQVPIVPFIDDEGGLGTLSDYAAALLALMPATTEAVALAAALDRLPDAYWSIEHHAWAGFVVQLPGQRPAMGKTLAAALAATGGEEG